MPYQFDPRSHKYRDTETLQTFRVDNIHSLDGHLVSNSNQGSNNQVHPNLQNYRHIRRLLLPIPDPQIHS
ncbi:MAG: hypothetical protein V7K21_20185 [Nostoc sp.]|uniref:hypothetical protein n=1 Tax=Nostoc sp. TaxID=1180 RepID=UPI002FF59C72